MNSLKNIQKWLKEKCNQDYSLEELQCITFLNLSFENLDFLHEDLHLIKNLKKLSIFGNKLKTLKISHNRITHINCSQNILKYLCVEYPNLIYLNCSSNNLEEIKLNCPNLLNLTCYSNRLTDIKLNCHKLMSIDLSYNRLIKINLKIGTLYHLNLNCNNLSNIVLNCPNLIALNILSNQETIYISIDSLNIKGFFLNNHIIVDSYSPIIDVLIQKQYKKYAIIEKTKISHLI